MQDNFKYINLSWAVVGICERSRVGEQSSGIPPPVETFPRFYLVLLRQPIAPMESDGMSRVCIRCNPRNVTKPLNICSDFHLDRHFFGLVGGFFVGLSVTLWLGMTNKTK